jgi:hypothetical protein
MKSDKELQLIESLDKEFCTMLAGFWFANQASAGVAACLLASYLGQILSQQTDTDHAFETNLAIIERMIRDIKQQGGGVH